VLADVTMSVEAAIGIAGAVLVTMAGSVAFMFRQLITSHSERLADQKAQCDREMKAMASEKDSYKEIAAEAVDALENKVNELRRAAGKPSFPTVPPVIPEHSSPVSAGQQDTADLQTLRARVTAAVSALGLPPRDTGVSENSGPAPAGG